MNIHDEHVERLQLDDEPDLVVIQAYITSARRSYEIAHHDRSRGPYVAIGGLHPTSLPDEAAAHADTIFTGPGEATWPDSSRTSPLAVPRRSPCRACGRWKGFRRFVAISHTKDTVEVGSPAVTVAARHVVMSIPPALASRVQYDPPLPADRALLLHQLRAGTEIKAVAVYDEPFWREVGLCGASVAMDDPFELTLDTSPQTGEQGDQHRIRSSLRGGHRFALDDPGCERQRCGASGCR